MRCLWKKARHVTSILQNVGLSGTPLLPRPTSVLEHADVSLASALPKHRGIALASTSLEGGKVPLPKAQSGENSRVKRKCIASASASLNDGKVLLPNASPEARSGLMNCSWPALSLSTPFTWEEALRGVQHGAAVVFSGERSMRLFPLTANLPLPHSFQRSAITKRAFSTSPGTSGGVLTQSCKASACPPRSFQRLEEVVKRVFSTSSGSSGGALAQCWNCGGAIAGHVPYFCPSCEAIQPPNASLNYFSLLGIDEPSFELDPGQLDAAYKDLQRRLHPDKFATGSEEELQASAAQSALVNQAYACLKHPLKRAVYLLEMRGGGQAHSGEGTITDPELLMEVMEARQAVEETDDAEGLARLAAANREQEQRCIQELTSAFRAGDLVAASNLTTQLRYITRIGQAIRTKQ